MKVFLPTLRARLRCTKNKQTPGLPTQSPETATAFSWPLTLPDFLTSCLNFYTCMGKRLFIIGGENTHFLPVISELGTTIETNHVRSRCVAASQRRCPGLLVWGKLIRLCQHPNKASKIFTISSWLLHQALALTVSHFRTSWSSKDGQAIGLITLVTVSSAFCPVSVSLDFHIPDDTNCHCFVLRTSLSIC